MLLGGWSFVETACWQYDSKLMLFFLMVFSHTDANVLRIIIDYLTVFFEI